MSKVTELDDVTLLKFFIALRDRRAKRKAAYEGDDADDKRKQDFIEVEFLRRFNERGIDNVSARGVGTAYRSSRSSATVSDKDTFREFVLAEGAWELADIRASKKAVEQYKEVNHDLPPGVKWSEMVTVNFQRN